MSTGTIQLFGGDNITLSQNANSVTISGRSHQDQTASIVQAVIIGGNTSGTTASISSGTMVLAGGYNITLSQIGNTITFSGGEQMTAVVSNLGNTAGTTGAPTMMDQLIFVGGSNITLSQSYLAEDVTITIIGANQSLQTDNLFDLTIGGNTTGTGALISSGTLTLVGGNSITLSQNGGNAITIIGSQSQQTDNIIREISIGGNTSGTLALISSGTMSLIGGYNITLVQDANTITISGGEQITAVVSDLGNTAGLTGAPTKMDQLIFVGGNNITLSQTYVGEDVTITISGANQSLQTQSIVRDVNIIGNTSGTTADITSGTMYLAGGNDIVLFQNGNSITISATGPLTAGMSNVGNTSGTTGPVHDLLVFVGGNNVTLSQSANLQSATLTISGPNMFSAGESNLGNELGTSGAVSQLLVLVGGNNVTLSQSITAGSATLTIIGANQSLQTSGLFDLTIGGNTTGTGALISSGTLFLAGGNNITLSQVGNSITISAPTDSITQFSAGMSTGGNTTGITGLAINQLVLAGGNEITLSGSTNGNSMTITISAANDTVTQFSAGMSAGIGNTTGTTGIAVNQLILAGGNNITLSGSTANASFMTITIEGPNQSTQTNNLFDLTLAGNTTGTLALVSSGTLTLAGGNNITLSQDGNAITISGPNTVAQSIQPAVNIGAGTQTATSGTVVFSNSNNFTFGMSNNSVITASFLESQQTQNIIREVSISGTHTAGTLTDITSGTLYLAGGANITLSQEGNSITISAGSAAAGSFSAGISTQGHTAGTTGFVQDQLLFVGSDNITLSQSINGQSATLTIIGATLAGGSFGAGVSSLGNTLGTTGTVSQQMIFVGGNNITLSQSIDGNSATLTIDAFSQTIQTANMVDITLAGNSTSAGTGFILISSGTMTLAGGNNITLSQNGNAITISGASQSVQTGSIVQAVVIAGNTSGTTASISSGTFQIAGGYNITLSQNQNSITISGGEIVTAVVSDLGNTAGLTGAPAKMDKLIFVGGNNITLSQTYVGEDVTITINGPADTISMFTAGMSNLGNIAGTTGLVYNQLVFVGGNEITLSQSINGQSATITINAAEDLITQLSVGISNLGNTVGTTGTVDNQIIFVGGNNVTLSQSIGVGASSQSATITISGANQSLQTQSIVRDVNIIGNTSGTTADITSGTMYLAGGNGIILSQNGNSITISGHEMTAGMSTFGNTSGTTGLVHDQLVFVGGNNVTLSQSVNLGSATLTISGPNMFSAGASNIGNTLGSTGPVSQLLVFVGGNNITLSESINAGSGTITISAPNQSVQTESRFNLTIGGNTTGTGALVSSGVLTLAGGNNITISQSGGNAITIYGASQTLQTSNLFDLTLSGNTAGAMALISSGTLTLAGGYNITLSQAGNAVTISGPEQLTAVVSNLGNTAGTTGAPAKMDQLVFVGGSNITLSQSYLGEDVTITFNAQSQSVQTNNLFDLTISGNTTGTGALISSGTLTLAGGNNITLSQSGNAITISGASQTLQTSGLFDFTISGNTTGTGALISSGTMTLAGGNNITLSQVGNAITISGHPLYSAGISNLGNTNGTTGVADNRLIIVGGNNISISQSLDALSNFGTITINGPNTQSQSAQTGNLFDLTLAGNSTSAGAGYILVSSGTLTLAGGNNITLSQNGNVITISGPNTVAQSIQTQSTHVHVISGNTTGTTASMSTGTIQLAGGNSITLSQNANSVTISGPQFSNSNNISFGANFGTITASASFSQSVQTGNLFDLTISGNTTGTGALISSGTLTLAGGANITLSQNGNAITVIGAVGGGGGVAIANSQTTFSSGTVNLLEGGGAITIASSVGGQSLRFSVPATSSLVQAGLVSISTAGSTITISGMGIGSLGVVGSTNTFTSGNVIFSGVANITLSTSVSDGSQYILISAPAPGGGATLSRWEYPHGAFVSIGAMGQGSYSLEHMYVPFNVTATMMRIGGSISAATNTSATTASANMSLCIGIYTLNGSTLSLASSGSANNGFRWSQSASTTGNTSINSMRQMTVPININMTPGEYWVGAVISSATTYTSAGFTIYGEDAINVLATGAQLAPIGSGTTAGRPAIFWQGIYTAATGACPVAISTNGINFSSISNANRANFHIMMANATYGII
jgi:hypothetical protein